MIQKELKVLSEIFELDYFGIADLSDVKSYVADMSGGILSDFRYAISLGITLPHSIVDSLVTEGSDFSKISYETHGYSLINDRLNYVSSAFFSFLQKRGYSAYPTAASQRYSDEKISSIFSHKLAAHLAGHGWIGKSCLLVTESDGPRVRWVTVLTNAPLEKTGTPRDSRCGTCQRCVDACPASAFTNRLFDPEESREKRYDARKCDEYFKKLERESKIKVCGLCLAVCPFGTNINI